MAWLLVLVAIVMLFALKSATLWMLALPVLALVIAALVFRSVWRILRGRDR